MEKEDYFTSTVDGAEGWARMHAVKESKYPDDYSPDDSPIDDYDDDDYDKCNCSDPGCPCSGIKHGCL